MLRFNQITAITFLTLVTATLTVNTLSAQAKGWFKPVVRKNSLFGFWGYNRAAYSQSDITFNGSEYNFNLVDVTANDRPSSFSFKEYFRPVSFTIPQYNFRLGYFINDHWSVSFGIDHMKYVMNTDQEVAIYGAINVPGSPYNGSYNGETIVLDTSFLTFEHTDGLNYLNIEAAYHGNIYQFNEKFRFDFLAGAGAGVLMPKSNVKLMGFKRNDQFHVAGFGTSVKVGLSVILWKYVMLGTEWKAGYIQMNDILSRQPEYPDRASQHFWYAQWNFHFGGVLPLYKSGYKKAE